MSTNIYLSHDKDKITLPVLPKEISVTNQADTQSVNIANVGEIVRLNGKKAMQISFSSQFPATAFQGSISKPLNPSAYYKKIKSWMDSKYPIRFVLERDANKYLGLSLTVVITDFKCKESGDDVGTIEYSITFKEYRKITVNEVKKKKSKSTKKKTSSRASTKSKPKTYTVKSGDTLWGIASKELGNGNKWKSIYNKNKSTIESAAKKHGRSSSSTGHWIYPGTVLNLP